MFDPNLKPYPDYKPSGVEWLGDVPTHWEVRRLKYLLQERDTRSADGHEQLLRVSQYTGVTQRKGVDGSDNPDTRAESLIGYKCVEHNDLVVNIMLAWNGSMGVSKFRGITSPAYCVYRFLDGAHPWFFHYLLRSPIYKAYIKNESTGIVDSRLRLYTDDLYRLYAFIPPLPEQVAIVRFLDHADRRIRRYIRDKQKLIALLEEQKQAIIHQAVTGQIDVRTGQSYPAYKDSGVEWLGEVPAHWEMKRLRSLANITTGGKDTINQRDDGKYPFFVRSQTVERIDTWSFEGEAVLTAGDGVGVGRVFHYANGKFDFHQRVYKLSDFNAIFGKFFYHYFRALLRFEVLQGTAKSTVDSLRLPMLQNFPVALPPLPEQTAIVCYLVKTTASIDTAIDCTRHQIELIQEYRTRLIADVVTGKLDVREAAAELPEVDPLAEDDLDSTIHDRENSNLGELDAEESAAEYTIAKEVTV